MSALSRDELDVASTYVAPRSTVEGRLAELWSSKLGVSPIGVRDDFFELGGDSLLAADLLMDIYHDLGVEIDASVLFLSPTIADLVEAMSVDDSEAPLR
ncbi:phosphopantetheine-binding protein [Micromonospora narathiwatensis]|uniref:Phosphopantetheine attachment site n=1 Tax=Micromonospora narathiwatensis TaxID=299146 RepID=A0A1A8ZGD3_9ACTN|nr:phosphopantetheine-binding protein [Micromonospora narathiwatensis]SBT42929.1 Phosphopantetheine attachment site [Micromonospora narathiwatensis]